MLLDCFEANWEYANYLVPVLLGASSTRLCNNLCELLGPTGGSSANNLSGSQEGQGLQSSLGLVGPAHCATPHLLGPLPSGSLIEDGVSVSPQREEARQKGLAEPPLLCSMLAVLSGEVVREVCPAGGWA